MTTFWFLWNIRDHNHATFMNQKVVLQNFIIELTGDKYFTYELFISFCNLVFGCFGGPSYQNIRQMFIYFFTDQGKTGKNKTYGNENLVTYLWYFGNFDEKQSYENM